MTTHEPIEHSTIVRTPRRLGAAKTRMRQVSAEEQPSPELAAQTAAVITSGPRSPDRSDVMKYLARLPAERQGESALAAMFKGGTAESVPVGTAKGYPVLFGSAPELNLLASQLWGGKTFRVTGEDAQGNPVVRLDNMIVRSETGGIFDLFDAHVTLGKVTDLTLGTNERRERVAPPSGTLKPATVSFLEQSVAIDDRPSVILNYFEDDTLPIIRRVLDEIREVDAQACPGFYLGRAHVRRCVSFGCGEFPTAIVDRLEQPLPGTRYDWRFWTYFLLDFSESATAVCDLGPLVSRVEQQLRDGGTQADLPEPPVVQ
jgi:hypothetical protein